MNMSTDNSEHFVEAQTGGEDIVAVESMGNSLG